MADVATPPEPQFPGEAALIAAGRFGFAKLVGQPGLNLEYFVQKYEVVLGRKSKQEDACDVVLGDNMAISRKHAKVVYNFETARWELVVLGKNGVTVNGKLYTPDLPAPQLLSQDVLQIADTRVVFLLPPSAETQQPQASPPQPDPQPPSGPVDAAPPS